MPLRKVCSGPKSGGVNSSQHRDIKKILRLTEEMYEDANNDQWGCFGDKGRRQAELIRHLFASSSIGLDDCSVKKSLQKIFDLTQAMTKLAESERARILADMEGMLIQRRAQVAYRQD